MSRAAVLHARASSKDQERESFSIPDNSSCSDRALLRSRRQHQRFAADKGAGGRAFLYPICDRFAGFLAPYVVSKLGRIAIASSGQYSAEVKVEESLPGQKFGLTLVSVRLVPAR